MRQQKSERSSTLRWTLTAAVAASFILAALPAGAFDNQPNGWEKHRWGVTAASVVKATPAFRKRYKARQIDKALEASDVVLSSKTEVVGREMTVKWTFSKKGLHTVTLEWEDSRPEAYAAYKDVMADLQKLWGEPDEVRPDGAMIWEGELTRAEARKARVASGSGVEIVLTAKKVDPEAPSGAADLPGGAGPKEKKGKGGKGDGGSILDEDPGVF